MLADSASPSRTTRHTSGPSQGRFFFCQLRREVRSNLSRSRPHSRLEPKSLLLNTHGERMRKKLDGNEAKKNMAEPGGMASERNDAQFEFEIALDPGPHLDPEGWMAERSAYWTEQEQPKKLGGAARWVAAMRAVLARLNPFPSARRRARLAQARELTPEEWARLSESALGPLRPAGLQTEDCGLPRAPLDCEPSPIWNVGELMIPFMEEIPMVSVPSAEDMEQALAPMPEVEAETMPVVAPARAARRRRP